MRGALSLAEILGQALGAQGRDAAARIDPEVDEVVADFRRDGDDISAAEIDAIFVEEEPRPPRRPRRARTSIPLFATNGDE